MPVRLHHIVIDAQDPPGLARPALNPGLSLLADPEGNALCVVRPKETLIS